MCKKDEEEMAAHKTTIHGKRNEKVAILENQLYAVQNLNHAKEKGRLLGIQSMVRAPSPNLKGNRNNLDMNLEYKLVSKYDDPLVSIRIEPTQNPCSDLIDPHVHTSAEILKVDTHCSIMHDHCYTLTDIYNSLHINNVDHVKLISHAEIFTRISPAECMFYVQLDDFVDINKILKSVLDISSMKSFNSAYSCKFTFNFIGHHAVNKFYVCAQA